MKKKLEEIERERLEEERRLEEIERKKEEERRLEEIERKKEDERREAEFEELMEKLRKERNLLELIDNIFLDESSRNKVKNLIVDIDIYETDKIIEIVKEEEIKYRSEVDIELLAKEYFSTHSDLERWYKIENHIVEANCSRTGKIERWYEDEGFVFVLPRARGEYHMFKDEDFLRNYFKRRNEYLIEDYK